MRPVPGSVARDQAATPFSGTLLRLCDSSSAVGAALVDAEGETVDYAGALDPFTIRVTAAEWRLVFALLTGSRVPEWTRTRELRVRSRHRSFFVTALADGYALVVVGRRRSFRLSPRALVEARRDLTREAGLPPSPGETEAWERVEVAADARRRPGRVWLEGGWQAVEVLGRCVEPPLTPGEVAFRVRLASGAEGTLVRERPGIWYAEGLVAARRGSEIA